VRRPFKDRTDAELLAERHRTPNPTESSSRHVSYFDQYAPSALEYKYIKTFRSPMRGVDVVANRMRMILKEKQGKRILLRVRVDLYGTFHGRAGYGCMKRAGIVLSAKDAKQAEAALVTLIRLTEKLNGMELDADDLRMEYL
jgi:hypothetical protein